MRPRVYYSDLTGRAYVATRYRERTPGHMVSEVKHDVTDDVVRLLSEAWSRGWDDREAATKGDLVANPYVPEQEAP